MGVPKSVNTVPKLKVSVEKVSVADGESVKSSFMQDEMIKPTTAAKVNNM